ncbi:phosphoribosylformylglycinamidine cyclo-ligase domain protein [Streptococcus intermedius BA1]|nr:phosphoribosylformylglycinamidine cyclo-ligase domain protein [Streptococcus intermedius BA1]
MRRLAFIDRPNSIAALLFPKKKRRKNIMTEKNAYAPRLTTD